VCGHPGEGEDDNRAECEGLGAHHLLPWRSVDYWTTGCVWTVWRKQVMISPGPLYRGSDGILCHAYHTAWFNFNEINLIEEIVNARTDSYARARRHVM
jgi:hypothetical protein